MGQKLSSRKNQKETDKIIQDIVNSGELLCDAECQKRKKMDQLRTKYNTEKNKLETAPQTYEAAYREYIDYKEGPGTYKILQESKKNTEFKDKQQKEYLNFLAKLNGVMMNYNTLLQQTYYEKHANDLIDIEEDTINDLDSNLQKAEDINNTENRFTYYQNQDLERNFAIIKYLKYLFFFLLIVFVGYFVLYLGNGSKNIYIFSAVMAVYPFIAKWTLDKVIAVYKYIKYMFSQLE